MTRSGSRRELGLYLNVISIVLAIGLGSGCAVTGNVQGPPIERTTQLEEQLRDTNRKLDEAEAEIARLRRVDADSERDRDRLASALDRERDMETVRVKSVEHVRVFYATDRKLTEATKPRLVFANEPANDDSFYLGECDIQIPTLSHETGVMERPEISFLGWTVDLQEFTEDPQKHIVLGHVSQPFSEKEFVSRIKSEVDGSPENDIFVFVHGYNVTFAEAARRAGQLKYDLQFKGAAVVYSWGSRGSWQKYTSDEIEVRLTTEHLKSFLLLLAKKSGAKRVHLIAHSLGNRPLAYAIKDIVVEDKTPLFKEIILAAPDIDQKLFFKLASSMKASSSRVTIYATEGDIPLILSEFFHKGPRVGQGKTQTGHITDIDLIDVSTLGSEHSILFNSRELIHDLINVLNGLRITSRPGLVPPEGRGSSTWTIRK